MGVLLLVSSLAFSDSRNDSLMKRVNNFCATEFNGDEGERIMYFLPNIRDDNVVNFKAAAVAIVDSYKVLSTTITDNSATVMVEYNLIAEIREVVYHGWPEGPQDPASELSLADKVVMVNNPKYVQKLLWKFNKVDREWYLVSSQLPKVSGNALLKLLRVDVERETNTLNENPGRSLPDLEAGRNWRLKKISMLENLGKPAVTPTPGTH
jgi:hypothetical protein